MLKKEADLSIDNSVIARGGGWLAGWLNKVEAPGYPKHCRTAVIVSFKDVPLMCMLTTKYT